MKLIFLIFVVLTGVAVAWETPIRSWKNQSTTPLSDGSTYTGDWADAEKFSRVKAAVYTDQPGILKIQFSSDKSTVMSERTYQVSTSVEVSTEAIRKWARVVYMDLGDGNTQSTFNIQMKLDHGEELENSAVNSGSISAGVDAFGRQRVSDTNQRLDVEFIYDKAPDLFDEVTNNGTVTHNANTRDVTLSLGDAVDGSYAKMSSHPVPYTPGNSQLIDITGVLDLAGIGGGTAEVFLRSSISGSVVTQTIEQSEWLNLQTGVDWTESHIFSIDFQSLKVGSIRYGLVKNGSFIPVAKIDNDDKRDSGYWQLPNLPAYYKIYNESGSTYMELGYGDESNGIGFRYKITANASATMKAICVTVKSEGGGDIATLPGIPRAIDMGVTAKTVSTTLIPLISIRTRATFNSLPNLSLVVPNSFNVRTDQPIKVVIVEGGALTGASWTNVNLSRSAVEYDTTATVLSGGRIVDSIYITASGAGANASGSGAGLLGKSFLWNRLSSETGILTLAAVRVTASDASVLAGLQWGEIR